MADEPQTLKELNLVLNTIKFGKLREDHLRIYADGSALRVIHEPTDIAVNISARDDIRENWELAQQAINSALEHQEAI